MTKNILFIVLGMFIMFILLKVLSSKSGGDSSTSKAAIALIKTQEAYNVARTNEFRELVKTQAFQNLVKTLASNEFKTLTTVLT